MNGHINTENTRSHGKRGLARLIWGLALGIVGVIVAAVGGFGLSLATGNNGYVDLGNAAFHGNGYAVVTDAYDWADASLAGAGYRDRHPLSHLDTVIRYGKADVDSISPVTQLHIGTGMTVRDLCDAAIRYSDGTAGNLLMRDIGGPSALTAYLRGLGDQASSMDDYEPALNDEPPTSTRDTTTPRTIAGAYRQIVVGDALTPDKRALIVDWMRRNTTGAADVRAAVPSGWTVADKTGHSDYGRANDIAIAWPPTGAPIVIAVLTDRVGYSTPAQVPIIADAARYVFSVLR